MSDKFGFVLEKIGLKGDGGLLNIPWLQERTIGPYMDYHLATAPTQNGGVGSNFGQPAGTQNITTLDDLEATLGL